ncbi:hypothetical protein B0H11DRAFT_636258 [Mycena galericulata]|nr:hypothetical protein B0H11DRAFT_636258 [Mycena galericulata]
MIQTIQSVLDSPQVLIYLHKYPLRRLIDFAAASEACIGTPLITSSSFHDKEISCIFFSEQWAVKQWEQETPAAFHGGRTFIQLLSAKRLMAAGQEGTPQSILQYLASVPLPSNRARKGDPSSLAHRTKQTVSLSSRTFTRLSATGALGSRIRTRLGWYSKKLEPSLLAHSTKLPLSSDLYLNGYIAAVHYRQLVVYESAPG